MNGALFDLLRQRPQLIFAVGVVALFALVLVCTGLYVLIKTSLSWPREVDENDVVRAQIEKRVQRRA